MIERVHHVGIVVRNVDQAMRFYGETLGLALHRDEIIDDQGVRAVLLALGDSEIELLQPVAPDSGVARYLESRGEGLHHICFQVDDLDRDLQALKDNDVELIDREPRLGLAGRICFLHPRAMHGTLVELCRPVEATAEMPADA